MHFSSFFFLLVTTPISLLNNFYFRIIAIFFSPSYPLLLIFLLFFPRHIFSLSFPLFCSIFFSKPSRTWARTHTRTRTRARAAVCFLLGSLRNFLPFFSQFFAIFHEFTRTEKNNFLPNEKYLKFCLFIKSRFRHKITFST